MFISELDNKFADFLVKKLAFCERHTASQGVLLRL